MGDINYMFNKLNNKWWIFTVLSFIFAYLNPYFGLFSMIMIVILFFDILFFIILRGHYNIFKQQLLDNKRNKEQTLKLFNRELLMFKIAKLFTTFFVVYVMITMVIENVETKTILAPFYISIIQEKILLQIFCIFLSLVSIIFSCVLFWFYTNSYKNKLNEQEL